MPSTTRARRRSRAAGPRIAHGLLVALVLSVPTVLLAVLVSTRWAPLLDLDQHIAVAATDVTRSHPTLRAALLAWQIAFHPQVVYLAAVPGVVLAWRHGRQGRARWATVTMLAGWTLEFQVKLLVRRARPVLAEPVSHSPGYSFPSGHAFNVTLMLTVSLIMLRPFLGRRRVRLACTVLAATLSLLTALDRIYLGVHFASDVIASILLALAVAGGSYAGFLHTPRTRASS